MLKSQFSSTRKGNVLFLILIAVALFAALTMAITKSNQGGNSLERERGAIDASDLMGYAASMEKTVARMLGNDMSENALSFENTTWQYNDDSQVETAALFGNCTSSACKIFDPAGGGLSAQTFAPQILSTPVTTDVKTGHGIVYSLKVNGVGTTAHDLVFMIAVIDQNTCRSINDNLNITNPSGFPPADSWAGALRYNGTFTGPGDATDEIGDVATQIRGKTAGCINRSGGSYGGQDNYFYQVLLPR